MLSLNLTSTRCRVVSTRPAVPLARHLYSQAHTNQNSRVAVLYQALEPPVVNGVRKPKKPGGYQDSGADIAWTLRNAGTNVVTPAAKPDPGSHEGWCFPDTEDGILEAVDKGVTHFWANTILFADHPLQTSIRLNRSEKDIRVVGQPPRFVQVYDDKNLVNEILRASKNLKLPKAALVGNLSALREAVAPKGPLSFPIVGKPVRGRGSHGVAVCQTPEALERHAGDLLEESLSIILEEYLSGQEGTVTVMPPSRERPDYWAMPVVVRYNHVNGIAPYNGNVAVTANSRTVTDEEAAQDSTFETVAEQCVQVARLLRCTAPIRIDIRRFKDASEFALFDVNMKPNMTGPGRPGREDQASLTAIAANGLGWDYAMLLRHILDSARTLYELRRIELPNDIFP
ncbi:D-alanine--D-alanine ligase [Truncatella angustata]|uniref:D-alanine--D-alanine ligase n=1 Tax=Truncatella angustata TaxID=152316 RepID=A0A9P8ZY58_9PEZI|nr:D-alanine--D-alanine ligase [Truncatella angustata]KAH6655686.1 D-alanine--D-alanine ligase [Truncatella angustata]KAH8201920.1 hypothetical protein TruAng_003912 [Truncatella angustata]